MAYEQMEINPEKDAEVRARAREWVREGNPFTVTAKRKDGAITLSDDLAGDIGLDIEILLNTASMFMAEHIASNYKKEERMEQVNMLAADFHTALRENLEAYEKEGGKQ